MMAFWFLEISHTCTFSVLLCPFLYSIFKNYLGWGWGIRILLLFGGGGIEKGLT